MAHLKVNGSDAERDDELQRGPRTLNNVPADKDIVLKETICLSNLTARNSVLAEKKPSIRVGNTDDARFVAREIVHGTDSWIHQTPDALVTFISGHSHFDQWRRDDFRSALQGGIIKLLNSLNIVIFDDGLHYGLSKIIGDVVREEEMLKLITAVKGGRLPLIGMVPVCRLQKQDYPFEPELYDSETLFTKELDLPIKLPLNQNHADYIYLANQSYREAGLTRVVLEKAIQEELGSAQGAQVIPMVAFLFQGELDDLERVKAYIENGVPVVVIEGCGGLGDIVAGAVSDSKEMDNARLRASLDQKLQKIFPSVSQTENGTLDSVNLILDILRASRGETAGQSHLAVQLLSVINGRLIDTFGDLNSAVLKSAVNSSSAKATPELFSSFMSLAVKCNKPDVASTMLLSRRPWSNMELPVSAFEMTLLLPGREKFVDFYLLQQFPVRKYLSHLKLMKLFREARDRQFFPEHVWEGILRYSIAQPVGPDFVINDLNKLVQKLTGIHDYIDIYELSATAFGEKSGLDPNTAERKAMNALLVFAALYNRPNLVRVLIKYSPEPLLQALFAESLFHGLYRNVSHLAMSEMLRNTCEQFAQTATDILDRGVSVSPVRGHGILTRRFADFNDKTPLEIAYDTNNKQFVAHPNVQSWLDQYYFNFIKVKGNMDNLKLFLSAILIFPMYLWLSFPRLCKTATTATPATITSSGPVRPTTAAEVEQVLANVKRIEAGEQAERTVDKVPFPPFMDMLKAVWAAPVVRFYTWHAFYWMFLILICVDIMLPPCRFIGVDIAVWVTAITMWLELVMRSMYDVQRFRKVIWFERAYDLTCQTVFNILFFLYRIYPYRYDHPFAGRVILAFGVLYYCYRVWGWFYYMEKTIGPLIRMTIQMFTLDLSRWIVLIAPFLISTTVIFMGVMNPDWPATGDDWRHAFYRGIFALFGPFSNELEYTPPCEAQRTKTNNYPPWKQSGAIPDYRCWSGDYDNYTCPTVSFWSYFFVIQYYVWLKLGMTNMLTAFYVTRNLAAAGVGPMVWKYHRCRIILDYATRTSLPPPFHALGYLYKMIKYCRKPNKFKFGYKLDERLFALSPQNGPKQPRWRTTGSQLHTDVAPAVDEDSGDSFTYWKGLALEYFRGKEQREAAAGMPQQQLNTLTGIQDDITILNRKVTSADQIMTDAEEATKQPAPSAAPPKQSQILTLAEIGQPIPHILARTSPYPGTSIMRVSVPNDKCGWKEVFRDYHPESYSSDEQPIDPKVTQRKPFSLTNYKRSPSRTSGSTASYQNASPISWITNVDHVSVPIPYLLEDEGVPRNPFGRTGLEGRGSLPKWGPNQKVYMVITSRRPGGFRYVMNRASERNKILPQAFLDQEESEFAVGCQIVDAFLNDSNDLNAYLDDHDLQSLDDMQEVVTKSLQTRLSNVVDNLARRTSPLMELYRGYCDSPLNTDNAWIETVVFHLNLPPFGIDRFEHYKWQFYSREDVLDNFDGAILTQVAQEYNLL